MTKLLAAACAALLWTGAVADDRAPSEPAPKARKAEKAPAPKGKPRAKAAPHKPAAAPAQAPEKPCEPVKPCPID
jgi:hypothetical protein